MSLLSVFASLRRDKTELENQLILVAINLPALTDLPHAASNARHAASSFFKLALDLASM